MVKHFILAAFLFFGPLGTSFADVTDPLDPFSSFSLQGEDNEADDLKTPDQLIIDATLLLDQERVLDARTKLLKALKKDPKAYKAHVMLAGYYLVHVGHFRLALKYIKQAQALFEEKNGKPPYSDLETQHMHAQILYYLSSIRLNLDNYQGALDVLDEFTSYKYYAAWYPGTRAWILMKLGRIEEAIRVARLGVLAGAEPGRTLNMLGILLSMHGERQDSIDIFKQAITYEMSLGSLGQPATPLNNTGEVFKETYDEERAESSWLKATSMTDGCDHVLPSLNLSLLYFDELNFRGAKRTMDSFETCIAQFPLRNGEEHRALVHLARGRTDLLTGKFDTAIQHFREALENRQWFGKIGTSVEDLEGAGLISLATGYEFGANSLATTVPLSIADRIQLAANITRYRFLSWWYFRRARQVLAENLNDLEDLYVRSTDSLIEYPTLGRVLSDFPTYLLERKLEIEKKRDDRQPSLAFYKLYLAENLLHHSRKSEGMKLLNDALSTLRPKFDDLLLLHGLMLTLKNIKVDSDEYASIAERAFSLSRASLRNYGLRLPVSSNTKDSKVLAVLEESPFLVKNDSKRLFSIEVEYVNNEYTLMFVSPEGSGGNVKVKGAVLEDIVNKLSDSVFSEDLG